YTIIHVILLLFVMSTFTGFGGLTSSLNKIPFQHIWYFWMILGLYITLPVINKFVQHASSKELDYFIAVLFGGSIFYQITFILGIKHYVNLNLVLCPIAYMVLGNYLSSKEFNIDKTKLVSLAVLVVLAVTAIKILAVNGYFPLEYVTGYDISLSPRVASQVDLGIFELLRVSAIFLILRYIFEMKDGIYSKIRKLLENDVLVRIYTSISKASYGMYLFHITLYLILSIWLKKLALSGTQVCVYIVFVTFALFLISWLVILAINRIPFVNKFSGYH
uniref:acyltransferase family protein n=1 Tax=Methanobrevibacter sp. TaxID=66852 RepID=UPI00388CF515